MSTYSSSGSSAAAGVLLGAVRVAACIQHPARWVTCHMIHITVDARAWAAAACPHLAKVNVACCKGACKHARCNDAGCKQGSMLQLHGKREHDGLLRPQLHGGQSGVPLRAWLARAETLHGPCTACEAYPIATRATHGDGVLHATRKRAMLRAVHSMLTAASECATTTAKTPPMAATGGVAKRRRYVVANLCDWHLMRRRRQRRAVQRSCTGAITRTRRLAIVRRSAWSTVEYHACRSSCTASAAPRPLRLALLHMRVRCCAVVQRW